MMVSKNAFTMTELIFVIVVFGILAAVGIPKLAATRSDAEASKKAHMIMTGALEIASYATAKGTTTDDLSIMSASVKALQRVGEAIINEAEKSVDFKTHSTDDCVTMQIAIQGNIDTLSLSFGTSLDSTCLSIQSLININEYPMQLRGQLVTY